MQGRDTPAGTRRAVVTGGAGFIGSHVVDRLVSDGYEVTVVDDLRTGTEANLAGAVESGRCRLLVADVNDRRALTEALEGAQFVAHMQANADVRGGTVDRRVDLEQNTLTTWEVAEACADAGVRSLVFASSATVYGEPQLFPTPETYVGRQTSLYGASKLAGEAMLQAYAEYFGFRLACFRFVSWIGPRYSHGVIWDFCNKLRADPSRLEILGDGQQKKSYLDVRDGIDAIFRVIRAEELDHDVFNVGHHDLLPVTDLASIVVEELGLEGVRFDYTGGVRGWVGDSPVVHLDTDRLRGLGWEPSRSIEESIRDTVRDVTDRLDRAEGNRP